MGDKANNKIRKVSPTGAVTTVVGTGAAGSADGPVSSATFSFPMEVRQDMFGNVYVSDTGSHKVRKISTSGIVSTSFGTGASASTDGVGILAAINYPSGIAFNRKGRKGWMFAVELWSHKVRMVLICNATSSGHIGSESCVCNVGYLRLSNGTCVTQCPGGTFANADNTICSSCSVGQFKNSSISVCTSCPDGTELNADASGCDLCGPGRYKSSALVNKCFDCPLGTEPNMFKLRIWLLSTVVQLFGMRAMSIIWKL